jgi:hypothetical protein
MQISSRSLLLIALLIPGAWARDVQLKWNEVAAVAVGHEVQLKLPEGTIRGQALAVRQDSLEVDIQETSNAKMYPKGQASIPRTLVTLIEVHQTKGVSGRIIGTVAGTFAGMIVGGEIVGHQDMSEGPGVTTWFVSTVGISTAGYLAGRSLDHHSTLIRVVP